MAGEIGETTETLSDFDNVFCGLFFISLYQYLHSE